MLLQGVQYELICLTAHLHRYLCDLRALAARLVTRPSRAAGRPEASGAGRQGAPRELAVGGGVFDER